MSEKKISKLVIQFMVGISIMFYVYEFLLRNLPGVLVNEYRHIWHFTTSQIGIIDSAYYWAYTPMQPFVGAIVDKFGVKKSLMLAILLCAIGCFSFSLEDKYFLLIASRFVIGFGSAFGFISVLKLATEWLEPRYTNFIAGLTTSLGKASAYGGMTVMTMALTYFGSDLLLYVLGIFGLILFVLAFIGVKDVKNINREESASLFEGVWKSLKSPQIWLNGFIGGALYLHTMIFSNLWGIVFFERSYNYSQSAAAATAAISFLGWSFGGPLAGFLVAKFGYRRLWITMSTLLSTVVFVIILYVKIPDQNFQMALCFLLGLVSSPQILIFPLAKTSLDDKYAGSSMAIANMIVMLGGFLGSMIGSMIKLDGNVVELQQALLIIPIITAIAFLMSFLLQDKEESNV